MEWLLEDDLSTERFMDDVPDDLSAEWLENEPAPRCTVAWLSERLVCILPAAPDWFAADPFWRMPAARLPPEQVRSPPNSPRDWLPREDSPLCMLPRVATDERVLLCTRPLPIDSVPRLPREEDAD